MRASHISASATHIFASATHVYASATHLHALFLFECHKRKSILVGREEFRQYDPKEEYYKVLSTSATNFYASATNFCCSENHFCASGTH